MKKMFILSLAASGLFLFPSLSYQQTAPVIGLHENTPNVVALTNARIVTAPGSVIETGTLVIRDGNIAAVGTDTPIPSDAVVRDMTGKTLYPGFIDMYTHYGLTSAAAGENTAETRHWHESVRPERSAAAIFAHDDASASRFRKRGFTTVAAYPPDGIFRGMGALVLLDGGRNDGTVLSTDTGQSLAFTRSRGSYGGSLMGAVALIRQTMLDASWYEKARAAWTASPAGQAAPETSASLEALAASLRERRPMLFETRDPLDIFRAADIAREFNLDMTIAGCGREYLRVDAIKATGLRLVLPLDFPDAPDVSADEITLRDLKHWDLAPGNPAMLSAAGVRFALTTEGLGGDDDFLGNLRTAVGRGLDRDTALAALTTTPAEWLGVETLTGRLDAGKLANIVVADGDLFDDSAKILETYVAGTRFEHEPLPEADPRGTWSLSMTPGFAAGTLTLEVTGEAARPKVTLVRGSTKIEALKPALDRRTLMLAFKADSLGHDGVVRMNGIVSGNEMNGSGVWVDGAQFRWSAALSKAFQPEIVAEKAKDAAAAEFPVVFPDGAYGYSAPPDQPEYVLVRNATVWTSGQEGILEGADVLVKKGKIARIGGNLKAPGDAVIVDGTGKHVTPGLIDAHSHVAVSRGVNEGSHSITSETRIRDVIDCDDINLYRQMAGGLTAACLLHGSANSIGGQNEVVKLRWGALPEDMILDDARPTIKFALGENVKQSNVQGPWTTRYPRSRMGVEQFMRDSFQAAKDYREAWRIYERDAGKNKNLVPPRRDLRLEPLVEVLDGKRWIHCHSYRQDEIEAMIRVADDMGFKVKVFIHNLEGYKVADIMREHGSYPTVFSDWWVYKFEVYDSIPYNGAILYSQGLLVSYNSDDTELARRMNLEAAKAVKYGGVPPVEALKFVTINPAVQLGIDHRTGSLEEGKDADFVVWSGSPLSTYSVCEQTWIDGRRYFDIGESRESFAETALQRNTLIQKIMAGGKSAVGDKGK